jgi:hypothetical protein
MSAKFKTTVHLIGGPDLEVDDLTEDEVVLVYKLLGNEPNGARIKFPAAGSMHYLSASRIHYITATPTTNETSK